MFWENGNFWNELELGWKSYLKRFYCLINLLISTAPSPVTLKKCLPPGKSDILICVLYSVICRRKSSSPCSILPRSSVESLYSGTIITAICISNIKLTCWAKSKTKIMGRFYPVWHYVKKGELKTHSPAQEKPRKSKTYRASLLSD